MIATYRLQLGPGFGFDDARALVPYFRRLGISHLYLSPITDARRGSTHGYDVVDHNRIRDELGGPDGFRALLRAARAAGLALILDIVPNHAGVGARNARWQDVLAYGPHSPYAFHFDVEWQPLKPELRRKILLPYLGRPYGEALDAGEITLVFEEGRLSAACGRDRFALAPATYADVLAAAFDGEDVHDRDAVAALAGEFATLAPHERGRADMLRTRLAVLAGRLDLPARLARVRGERLHAILERQFWRLASWKVAAHEINYRRFFDVNDLVGLRMERPEVFDDAHRLIARLAAQPGVEGVRVDHIDGLFDPQAYLERLRTIGVRGVWVEKILALGETLPPNWPVEGTSGYEFLNDVLGLLTRPEGALPLDRAWRWFVRDPRPYADVAYESRRLVMDTSLAGELSRLAYSLDRISEGDYHTRDFTFEALRQALADITAALPRYRTYLPHDRPEAERTIREAVHEARRRHPGVEPTVYAFVGAALLGEVAPPLREAAAAWAAQFQQYTAPLAAKGVEDTAFYRWLRLVALNEVGGAPDRFGVPARAFHARARFRAHRYPRTLLATATHDHKRGEDLRARLVALAEIPEIWRRTVGVLSGLARRHRSPDGPSRGDEYLFYQTLAGLWHGAAREELAGRLAAYMLKAAREAKLRTSWLSPDAAYEAALERFVCGMIADARVGRAVDPLARALARAGFANSLSQLVVKLTSPGVPDFYQGTELLDLSLVDPDNRRPVDFEARTRLLDELEPHLAQPDPAVLRGWVEALDPRAKFFVTVRLLRFRQAHPALFAGTYRPLEAEGPQAGCLVAYTREAANAALVVAVPRFPLALERAGGFGATRLALPAEPGGRPWSDVLTEQPLDAGASWRAAAWPLPWVVLFSEAESPGGSAPSGV
ncbi:MAG: malto-oligosyltrehalose synthase [Armatimonadota bacterium]|nr:malto-oligosyltrehalose synthase [Armatimonadota bacterium]